MFRTPTSTNITEQAELLFNEYTGKPGGTMRDLALKYGLKVSDVLLRLRLCAVAPEIWEAAKAGRLSDRQIKRICGAATPATQLRYFREAMK